VCRHTISPMDSVETTFRLLATGPQPLALNGPVIGLRKESIGLWDLRSLLFHPATAVGVQRAALLELVRRARQRRGAWMIGLVGVLLPGLRDQVTCLAEGGSGGQAGSGAMALVNLLERLDDPGLPNEAAAESLLRTVVRPPAPSARSACRRQLAAVPGAFR
jgi:hypothetical protein